MESDRHYCRNPRCRSKLPSPVANPREAFCTRGCHTSFYRKRCLVCEGEMVRKTEHQLVCGKRRCRNTLSRGETFGRYHASSSAFSRPEVPSFIESKWAVVAGPPLTSNRLRCATVPDGPDCQWKGGEYERIEARNMDLLADAWVKSCRAKRTGHMRLDGTPADWKPCLPSDWESLPDLPIPEFLRR